MASDIKIGAVAWGLPGGGALAPHVAGLAGLAGIQLELGSHREGYPLTQHGVIDGYRQAAEQYQLAYPALVVNDVMEHPFIHGKDTADGKIAYEQIALAVESADKLGIQKIMIPNFEKNLITQPSHILHTMDLLRFACERARPKGILILTENGMDAPSQRAMLCELGLANLKVHFDTQNFRFNFGLDQCEQLRGLYDLMDDQLHTKDGVGKPGELPLGEGNTDFHGQMAELRRRGFSGWIVIENYYNLLPLRERAPGGDQMQLLKADIAAIQSCFA